MQAWLHARKSGVATQQPSETQRIATLTARIIALEQKVENLLILKREQMQRRQQEQKEQQECRLSGRGAHRNRVAVENGRRRRGVYTASAEPVNDWQYDEHCPSFLVDLTPDLLRYLLSWLTPFSRHWAAAVRTCSTIRASCWAEVFQYYDPVSGSFQIVQAVAKASRHVEAVLRVLEHPRLAAASSELVLAMHDDGPAEGVQPVRQRALDCALTRSVEFGRLAAVETLLDLGADPTHEDFFCVFSGALNDQHEALEILRRHFRTRSRDVAKEQQVPPENLLQYLAQRVILSGKVKTYALLIEWASSGEAANPRM